MQLKPLSRPLTEPGGAQAHHLHDTGLELTSGTRRRPHQQQAAVICSASQASCSDGLVRRHQREVGPLSRGVISPEGSTPIRPATGRPSLPPSSSTRRPLGPPYGGPTPKGGRRAYHVPRTYQGWFRLCLFAGGSTAEGHLRAVPGEFRDPLLFREHGGRSRCTYHVSLQRFMRRRLLPSPGSLGMVPPARRYYEALRLPDVPFAALRFLRLAIPSLRPSFVPDGPGHGAVDPPGVGKPGLRPAFRWRRQGLPSSRGTLVIIRHALRPRWDQAG